MTHDVNKNFISRAHPKVTKIVKKIGFLNKPLKISTLEPDKIFVLHLVFFGKIKRKKILINKD